MFDIGTHIRVSNNYGIIKDDAGLSHDGTRRWIVEWDSGDASITPETSLQDVDAEELRESEREIAPSDKCPYRHKKCGCGCVLRKGHRVVNHRSRESVYGDDSWELVVGQHVSG